MHTKNLAIFTVVLALGLSALFILPKSPGLRQAGVNMDLPSRVEASFIWHGEEVEVSEREREVLAPDTEFARKVYTNGIGDQIYVSIVLSGEDMNDSIHRPERCLPAQGWTVQDSRAARIWMDRPDSVVGQESLELAPTEEDMEEVGNPSPERFALETTRLFNMARHRIDEENSIQINSIHYYWFVGHRDVTHSHFTRTLFDIRDRILEGSNQRWAYITVTMNITENLMPFGRTPEETDELLTNFIQTVYPDLDTRYEVMKQRDRLVDASAP